MCRRNIFSFLMVFTFLSVSALFFTSCEDISDERIELNFKLEYDGQPLVMSAQDYSYPDSNPMIISKSIFYISNFSLSNADKTSNKSEIYALDFENANATAAGAAAGIDIVVPDLGTNTTYTSLSFDLGIDATRNAMEPADFEPSHPLANGDYWPGWNSYIFSKNEGKIDADGDGLYEINMSLHLGSDEAVRRKELQVEFDQKTTSVDIVIDLKKLFESSGGMYDIYTTPTTHALANMPQVMELSDNLINCFSINQ